MDRGVIDAQLREIGESDRWWELPEFRDLPQVLSSDERILGLATGRMRGSRLSRIRPGRAWLFVVTDQRLICLQQQRMARGQLDLAASQVTRIAQRTGLRRHQITLWTGTRQYRLRIGKAEAFRFVTALGMAMPQTQRAPLPPDLEPLAWIPGFTTVAELPAVAGLFAKVAALSPPEYAGKAHVGRLEATVEQLQADVAQLQQQVKFLEDLLQKRAQESYLPAAASED